MGLYGKLPCRGDFVQRRVSREFVDPWDAWLRECLTRSREQLRGRWLDAYLVSPVWRFALAAGLCGEGAYVGVMLPSVDQVGRYFPLTIMARWEATVSPLMVACSQDSWFERAQALALEALDAPILDFDDFDKKVAALSSNWYVPTASGRSLRSALSIVAFQALERTLHPVSLWWTEGSQDLDPSVMCLSGLPDPGSFVTMLSGESAGA